MNQRARLTTERAPPRDPGWLVAHYVLAVTFVAILLCVGQLLIQRELLQQQDGLRRTEAVHEQILLSNRLTRHDPEAVRRFTENEISLSLSLSDDPEALAMLNRTQSSLDRLATMTTDPALAAPVVRGALETLVVHLNASSQARLRDLRWTELVILALVLITLTAETLLVFRPAASQIRTLFGQLEATRLLLSKRLKRLNDSHESIKADLRSAAAVQRSLLPKEAPEVPGFAFAWSFKASRDVAGDMFDLIRLDESHLAVYVLDVAGHGVPAALLSVSLSRTITANLGSLLKKRTVEPPYYQLVRPSEVARELNRRFPVMSETDQFFTLVYGIIDTRELTFTFVQAGHPGPVHISGDSARTWEDAPDPPIGIVDDLELTETTVYLQQGDVLCIYTDGVVEARGPHEEMYGLPRVIETLLQERSQGVAACLEALYDHLRSFTQGQAQKDDVTLVGFEVTGSPVAAYADATGHPVSIPARAPFGAARVTSSGRYRSVQIPDN